MARATAPHHGLVATLALRNGLLATFAFRNGLLAALALLAATPAAAVPGDPFDLRAACRDDFRRHCAYLGPDATRDQVLRCLEKREDELQPACRIAIGEERDGVEDPLPPRPGVR